MKLTPSQTKTIELMTSVHKGGTVELLPSGDAKLIVPTLLPEYYEREALIISRRGKIIAEYLTTVDGDRRAKYF